MNPVKHLLLEFNQFRDGFLLMDFQKCGILLPYPADRIHISSRILENHGYIPAADAFKLRGRHMINAFTEQGDGPLPGRCLWQQALNSMENRGFAAPTLADDADDLSLLHREGDITDRILYAVIGN